MTNPTETTCPKCGADSKGALEYKCGTKHSPKGAVHLYSDLCRATSAERAVEILKQHVSDLELHVSSDGVRLGLVDSLREKRRKVAELERDLAGAREENEHLKEQIHRHVKKHFDLISQDAPQWRHMPTCVGDWMFIPGIDRTGKIVSVTDPNDWAPFSRKCWLGPIPEPPKEQK